MSWLTKAAMTISNAFRLTDRGAYRNFTGQTSESYSGKTVSVDSSLSLAAVWGCVWLISRTIASLPLMVYAEDADGNRTVDKNHPLANILRYQPNADMTGVEFWEAMVACLLLWGNAFARITRNVVGDVISLDPMPPDRVSVQWTQAGDLIYRYSTLWGTTEQLTDEDVFHIKGSSLNGIFGLSPIAYARHSMGNAMATDEASGKIFANGLRPSAILSYKEWLKTEQRDRLRTIIAETQGNENRGRAVVMEGGATITALSIPPEDAQMLETRNFNVEEICRWFHVPPWMVGHMTKSTSWGTGLEQQMIGFHTFTLKPWTDRIAQGVRRAMVPVTQRSTTIIQHDFADLLRADSAGRAALVGVQAQNGVRTRNELRREDGFGPLDGGDKLTVQSNLVMLDKLGDAPPAPPAQTGAGFGLAKPPAAPNEGTADAQ